MAYCVREGVTRCQATLVARKGQGMNEAQYIAERLDDQIDWYDRKSQSNQSWYKRLRLAELALAASIPFAAGFIAEGEDPVFLKIIVGGAGAIVAVIAGVLSLYSFQERWVEYRTTCETLRHHKLRYLTKTAPYAENSELSALVENVESLISKENTNWAEQIRSQAAKEKVRPA